MRTKSNHKTLGVLTVYHSAAKESGRKLLKLVESNSKAMSVRSGVVWRKLEQGDPKHVDMETIAELGILEPFDLHCYIST